MKKLLLTAFLVFGITAAAFAQSPFSASELTRFIDDWPSLMSMTEEAGEALEDDASGLESLRYSSMIQDWLKSRGWDSERFFYIADHAVRGVTSLQLGSESGEMAAQMEANRQAIMSDTTMSEQQRQQMLQMLDQSMQNMAQMITPEDIPASEMDLIKGNLPQLLDALQMR